MLTESVVDKRIQQTVDFAQGSDTRLKCACIAASVIVGMYKDGGTQAIAKAAKRHVSSVENWAHAHWLYKELRRETKWARHLWRALPASHWWLAWDIQQAGYEALYYLDMADKHNWSGRDMLKEYRADLDANNAPMQLKRIKISFIGAARELYENYDKLTEAQQMAVIEVLAAFGDNNG